MKKLFIIWLLFNIFSLLYSSAEAQCSVCTRTAEQLGEEPARGLNAGIIYLAFTPLALVGYIGYRWWKSEQKAVSEENNY
jgi:hypothetical protein